MPIRNVFAFRRQRGPLRLVAALLSVVCVCSVAVVAAGQAAPQKDKQEAARRAFEEGGRLRGLATPESLRGAVQKYEEAIRLWRESGDQEGESRGLASLGLTLQLLHRHESAVEVYRQALALLRRSGERPEAGNVLYNLGTAQLFLGHFNEAVETYESALAIQRRFKDRGGEAGTLAYLGAASERLGRYAQAIENFEQALAIYRELRDRAREGVLLNNLGAAYNGLGRYDRALEQYQRALAVYREVRDRVNEGTTLANVGFAFYKLGQTGKAIEYYERALALQRELADRSQEANTLTKLALAQLAAGRAAEALSTSERALVLQRDLKDKYGEGRALDARGQIQRALGKLDISLEYLGSALALMRELGAGAGEAGTLGELMLTCKARGATRLAIFYGKQAVNTLQELRRNIRGLDRESQGAFVGARQETYRTLAGLLVSEGRLPEAQQVLDMLKQDEYLQFVRRDGGETSALAGRAALSPEEAALEARYRAISDRVADIGRRWSELAAKPSLTPEEQQQLADLEKQLEVANTAFQKFLDQLDAEFARGGAGGDNKIYQLREAEGLKEVLRELGGDAVALYTIITEQKYYVLLYTRDAMIAREYPIRAAELNAKIFAFREAVQSPSTDPRPLAQELYRIIFGPVAKDLEQARAETLMWSLDGALRYVPLAALHDGERYVVERYRNVVFTPATQANLKDRPRAQTKGLGFGVSKAHGDFGALPAVPEELRSIFREESAPSAPEARGVLPGRILMDEEFTGEALRSALRQRYPLVHIASHFAFKPGDETDSSLLLGDGRLLTLAQIKSATNLFGGVDLLTLSACDTASGGAATDGREVESFGVLAQRQGAKAVLASLWPVADASTRRLMQEFYRLRGEGEAMTKAEALRRAQLELLRGGADAQASARERRGLSVGGATPPRFSHPYFWAPFILIGNWR
ncbi:MAG TPA: CHAT domain-containing protein [Pyrinomonadaceae bacterium]|nr:CHAT domain-containing protein [Pyrinomonadaceae bacterium]